MLMYEVSVYPFISLNHMKVSKGANFIAGTFSVVADTSIYGPYYNKWSAKFFSSYE